MPREISCSKKEFKIGKPNKFIVFGEGIAPLDGAGNPVLPNVYLSSRTFLWGETNISFRNIDAVDIEARCLKKKTPGLLAAAATAADGDDDLTITVVLDEGGGGEDISECTEEDVDYIP